MELLTIIMLSNKLDNNYSVVNMYTSNLKLT